MPLASAVLPLSRVPRLPCQLAVRGTSGTRWHCQNLPVAHVPPDSSGAPSMFVDDPATNWMSHCTHRLEPPNTHPENHHHLRPLLSLPPSSAARVQYFSPHLFLPRLQPLVVASLASSRQNEGRGMFTIMLQPVSPLHCIASLCSRYHLCVPLGVWSCAAGAPPYYPLKLLSDLAMLILCYPDSSPPPGPGWYPAR